MRPFAPFIAVGIALCWLVPVANAADTAPPDNAATYYRQACDALPKGDDVDRVFDDWQKVTFDGPTIKILRQCDPALDLMQRGASIKKCDWGLDSSKGFELDAPELKSAKRLSQATCLKIRYLGEIKRYERIAALSADLMTLGRHLCAQRMIISRLLGSGVEASGMQAACRYLPDLPVPVLEQLRDRLAGLPEPTSLADTFRNEGRVIAATIKLKPATIRGEPFVKDVPEDSAARAQLADQVVAAFDKAAKDVSVPLHDLAGTQMKLTMLIAQPAGGAPVGQFTAFCLSTMNEECRTLSRRSLMPAVVTLTLKGPAAIDDSRDPFGYGFGRTRIEGGWNIHANAHDEKGKPISLKTGPHAFDD
ncbi:MAG: hypothetical protein JWL69_4878 [Phycisphaerales bacterium]|nr:hypothetical protein [Phycisphaerales bacterium]